MYKTKHAAIDLQVRQDSFHQARFMIRHRPMNLRRRLGRITRPLRYALAVPALDSFRLIAAILPHRAGLQVGRWIGRLVALVDAKQRRLAWRQLKRAGIGTDPVELRRLSTEIFLQIGMGAPEALHSLKWTPEQYRQHVRFEGLKIIQSALERGGGFIIVSAHMGNWELVPRVYHAYTGQIPAAVLL
jgi:lauroyl/myristoyl acyltransferase